MKSKSTARSGKGEQRVALSLHALCTAVVCAPVAALPAHLFAQAPARPELSIKLVDPRMLRVCADPHNMPFSTETGEGFENKLAELLAGQLGKGLAYTWYLQAPGFVRNTLRAYKCGVLIGVPQGDDIVQVTNPYYRTAYALVLKHGSGLWPSREFLMIAARGRSSLPLGFEGPAKDFSLRKKGSFLRRCKSTLRDSCAPACGRLWHSRDPQPRHPEGIFIALQGEGVHCPTQARGLLTLKIRPGLPSAITTAWCASVRRRGAPIWAP